MSWVSDMRVVVRGHVGVQRPTAEYIMSRKRYEQRVLDVVVESVAISNALEGYASGRWHYLQVPAALIAAPTR